MKPGGLQQPLNQVEAGRIGSADRATRASHRAPTGLGHSAGIDLRGERPSISPYSDLGDIQAWARAKMQRPPDFVIGDDYLRRWWIVPRNHGCNVYLHEILHSDDDRALHDHPWDNTSMLLLGGYVEHTPEGRFERTAGSIVTRSATDAHRLEIPEGGRAISLFLTGPVIRQWGFHCPQGWRHWREFVDDRDSGKIGRGCA